MIIDGNGALEDEMEHETEPKKSCIVSLYHETMYCQFIHHIRKTHYGKDWNLDVILVKNQRVLSWMFEINGLHKLITDGDNLMFEKSMIYTT